MKICRRMVAIAAAPLAAALLLLAAPGLPVAAADGGRSAAVPATPHLVSTVPSTMATTNDKVNALAYANGVVYAGGFFTRMTFKGVSYVRHHLGAVSSTTGAPTSFHPDINGEVTAIALSPNRKLLYVAGRFTAVGKAVRTDVAAFSTATGKLTSFAPAILAGSLQAIAVTSSGIYLGGTITHVDGKPRTEAAEVTPQGKVTGWAPRLDGWVRALLVSPDKTRIFLGGGFHHVNGVAREALASVNLTTGAREKFVNGLVPTYRDGRISQVTSLTTNGTWIFAGAEGTGHDAFDGTLAFRPRTGKLVWRNTCRGATQAVLYLRGVLYKASHAHDCATAGGFPHLEPGWQPHRLLAENPTTGKLLAWGTTAKHIAHPLPDTNGGVRSHLGPFALVTDGSQLFVGGEFTTVNGRTREGLARFRL